MRFDWLLRDTRGPRSKKLTPTATEVQWRRAARRTRGDRTIGGTLAATGTRVTHTPDARNRRSDRAVTALLFTQISAIGVQEQTHQRAGRELRRRLRIDCHNGDVHMFLLEDPAGAAHALNALSAGEPQAPSDSLYALYDAWVDAGTDAGVTPR